MQSRHPEEIGYGHVVESYVTRMYGGLPRYLVLGGQRFLSPRWWHTTRFTRQLVDDATAITDEELEALLGYEWRSRLTAGWLIGVDRRERFRTRVGDLLLAAEADYSASAYCFALARFGTPADAEILTSCLDRRLPRTDLYADQPAALGSLLRLDARLGTRHADRFTEPGGPWDAWAEGVERLGHPRHTPAELLRRTDLLCDFADGWTRPAPKPFSRRARARGGVVRGGPRRPA
ncbi:DUF6000 family protein [Streptomyces sp. NPDC088090]|uniref:DUF6000 family protein n=1 Tax=Streptomyces sp. NPDC088090 TaxID=3365822 RepID=UPI0038514500